MYQPLRNGHRVYQGSSFIPTCVCCLALFTILILGSAVVVLLMAGDITDHLSVIFQNVDESEISESFQNFIVDYGKDYSTTEIYEERKKVFAFNYRRIIANNNHPGAEVILGVNEFADLTDDEFATLYLSTPSDNPECTVTKKARGFNFLKQNPKAEIEINWVNKGRVAPVKDQGNCGSCWTFAATCAIESAYAIKKNINPILFAEQQLVDCCRPPICPHGAGCMGGIVHQAFYYVQERGFAKGSDYEYKAADGRCREKEVPLQKVVKSYVNITKGDLAEMEKIIQQQPIAVGIDASHYVIRFYKRGVITQGCPLVGINHGVTVVGAGNEAGIIYWLVRNSWGPRWGDKGYMKIKRVGGDGLCGINTCPQYPIAP